MTARRIASRFFAAGLLALTLTSCGLFGEQGPVRIAAIGPLNPAANPIRGELSATNAALLEATSQGLVSYDAEGRLIAARDALDLEKGWPGTSYGYTILASGQSVLSSRTNSEGERVEFAPVGTFEEILFGPSRVADGTMNLIGALRRSMATTGYSDLKEFQRIDVVISPYHPS